MTAGPQVRPSSDERAKAALAHFFGLLAALIVWAVEKDKSTYVRFQSLQALAFEAVVLSVNILLLICLFGVMFIGLPALVLVPSLGANSPDNTNFMLALPILLPFALFAIYLPLGMAWFIPRFIAAISVLQGRDFRYPLIGKRLERFLDS